MVDPDLTPAPSPDPTPAPTDWRTGLTGDFAPLAQEKSLESFKGQDWTEVGPHLARAFVETKKLVGTKPQGLLDPGEKATPEEKAAYQTELRKRMGVPEKATDYRVKRPDVAQDGAWDAKAEAAFLGLMHQHGASPPLVQAALDFYGQWERTRLETAAADARSVEAKLRSEWGVNYDAKVGRANRAITEFGGADLEVALMDPASPLHAASRHPAVIRAWAAVGDTLVEHGAMSGEGLHGVSPEDARSRADALRKELRDLPEAHPRRPAIVDEIISLTRATGGR